MVLFTRVTATTTGRDNCLIGEARGYARFEVAISGVAKDRMALCYDKLESEGWIMSHLLNNNRLLAVVAGGVFLVVAAVLMQRVRDVTAEQERTATLAVKAVG